MGEMNDRIPYQAITLVKEFLKNNHDLAVLDLGCGEGDFLFGLINDEELTFQLIHAVDNMKEDYRFNLGLDLNIIYRSRFPDIKREPKIDFKVKDLCEFIDETSDKYNLIILSNIIHFYPQEQIIKILRQSQRILTTDGIIYVKMANERHPYADQKDKTVFSGKFKTELQQGFAIMHLNNSDSQAEFIIK